jgi:hypothetical protein
VIDECDVSSLMTFLVTMKSMRRDETSWMTSIAATNRNEMRGAQRLPSQQLMQQDKPKNLLMTTNATRGEEPNDPHFSNERNKTTTNKNSYDDAQLTKKQNNGHPQQLLGPAPRGHRRE